MNTNTDINEAKKSFFIVLLQKNGDLNNQRLTARPPANTKTYMK